MPLKNKSTNKLRQKRNFLTGWHGMSFTLDSFLIHAYTKLNVIQGSSERSDRCVRFEPNLRSERVRYFSERETNMEAFKRLISL